MSSPEQGPQPGGPSLSVGEDLAAVAAPVQRAEVVAEIRRRPQERSGLCRTLRLSPSLISRLTQTLLDQRVLLESPMATHTRGRPPSLLSVNPEAGVIASVLADGEALDVRVVDAAGGVLDTTRIPYPDGGLGLGEFVEEVTGVITGARGGRKVLGVGVGVPGIVGADGSVRSAPDLGWVEPVPVGPAITESLGAPVSLENDVNLMMLAEASFGCAEESDDAALLYLGRRGIGLGILSGGKLLTGARHASGEIGQIPLDLLTSPRLSRGSAPCTLEDRFSLEALSAFLGDHGVDPGGDPVSAILAHRDEADISTFLDQVCSVIENTIGVLSLILDPDVVILGGALRTLFRGSPDGLAHDLAAWIPSPPVIRSSEFGDQQMHWSLQSQCWNTVIVRGI